MSSFFWNMFQSGQIDQNAIKSSHNSVRTNSNSQDLTYLQDRLDTLSLANQAMWELLSEQLGLSEADLLKRMEHIDLRDGVKDGKITKPVIQKCPECGHQSKTHRACCYWCGASLSSTSPFAG
ncbi:hypothetical protein [Aliagarivorans marinus]|uniref:hypothetical protein n=1 Tax=Aliagarivorans marinus TaxID=561965 RepID=UPI000428A2E1|nr:hypothetical protein [Aliagarivorans marinus]